MSDKKISQAIPPFAQSKKKHLVIIVSLCAILLGLGAAYLFFFEAIQEEADLFVRVRDEQTKEEMIVRSMRAEKIAVRDTSEDRARLDTYFMNEKTVAAFLGQVEALGAELGLEVRTVSLGAGEAALRVAIHAEGRFSSFARFVAAFEKMPFKLRIDHAALNTHAAGEWTGDFDASVESFSSNK